MCSDFVRLQPVSLEKVEMAVEEVGPSTEFLDEDETLNAALKLSLGEAPEETKQQSPSRGDQGFDEFLGRIFDFSMLKMSSTLKETRSGSDAAPLMKLLLDLLRCTKHEELKSKRAKLFVQDICGCISKILRTSSNQKQDQHDISKLICCLMALSSLLKSQSGDDVGHSQASTYVCTEHGVKAVRRRCAKGVNKDRRFYVCGKDKPHRCNYFVWADDAEKTTQPKRNEFYGVVKEYFWDNSGGTSDALHSRLCDLLEEEILDDRQADASLLGAPGSKERKTEEKSLKGFYTAQNMVVEYHEGVLVSKEKLGDLEFASTLEVDELLGTHDLSTQGGTPGITRGTQVLEAATDLVRLLADHKTAGISRWFSMLCEFEMSNRHSYIRSQSMKALKNLCCGNVNLYNTIRDDFSFQFFLRRLYNLSYDMLSSALVVRKRTKQCSEEWRGEAPSWSNLKAGDFIGVQELIPEDVISEVNTKKIGKTLDDLWSVVKNRGSSWRSFCGVSSLPRSHREHKMSETCLINLGSTPPIIVLFWIACASSGTNKVKALRLIDFACQKSHGNNSDDQHDNNADGDMPENSAESGTGVLKLKPEDILLSGSSKLTVRDVGLLALNMVHDGSTSIIRRSAYHLIFKLVEQIDDRWEVFQNLVSAVEDFGVRGKAGVEFLNLLQVLTQFLNPNDSIGTIGNIIVDAFVQQFNCMKYDRSNGDEWFAIDNGTGTSNSRKKFDLSDCSFCRQTQKELVCKPADRRDATPSGGSGTEPNSSSNGPDSLTSPRVSGQKWHTEQVSQFLRQRLEMDKTFNEFNLFFKLRCRLAISDIHVTINDPRGRYGKNERDVFFGWCVLIFF